MNAFTAIKKIKIALGLEKFEAVAELVDGTKVHVDGEFEVGEQLHVVAEDGEFTPAPEGQHTTTDGMMITVDAAGVITAVESAEEETEEVSVEVEAEKKEEEMAEEEMAEVEEEVKVEAEEKEEIEVKLEDEVVEKVVAALKPFMDDLKETKEELEALKASFSKFSDEPAAKPVRNNFQKEAEQKVSLQEKRMEALVAIRRKNLN